MKKGGIIIIFLLLVSSFIQAQIIRCENDPCDWNDLSQNISNLITTIVRLALALAIFLSTTGAFLMMFRGVKEKWYAIGRSMIETAIIGYALILLSGIVIDLILDIFNPQLKQVSFFLPRFSLAQIDPKTFYQPLRDSIGSSLRCGRGGTSIFTFPSPFLNQIFNCVFEILAFLKNIALVLFALAIIISAFYLITSPLLGLQNISKAWNVLKWSFIGLIVILTADVIKDQILRILSPTI